MGAPVSVILKLVSFRYQYTGHYIEMLPLSDIKLKKDPKKSEAENETGTSAEQHVEGTKFVHTE